LGLSFFLILKISAIPQIFDPEADIAVGSRFLVLEITRN